MGDLGKPALKIVRLSTGFQRFAVVCSYSECSKLNIAESDMGLVGRRGLEP